MIIGKGLLGKALIKIDHKDFIFFASGVSDSKTKNLNFFNREKKLLLEVIKNNKKLKLIYFSTCDFYDSTKKQSPYLKHKKNMENIIKKNCKNWIIFRISQIVGKNGNKNNLLFKLCVNVIENKNFTLYPFFERNLIEINDVIKIIKFYLKNNNKIINIANPFNIKVINLIKIIEKKLNKKALFNTKVKKNKFQIPLDSYFPYHLFYDMYYEKNIKKFISFFAKNS